MKTNDYSLNNLENYNKNLDYKIHEIVNKYISLLNEFLKFILEKITTKPWKNSSKTAFESSAKFIIIRGYETITNVFNIVLYYTKNLDLTFYHCQKAYYYYIEFIEQISNVDHIFLQLNSRDATTYVYKKTLSELDEDIKKNLHSSSTNTKHAIKIIDEHTKIFKNIFEFLLQFLDVNNVSSTNTKIIERFITTCEKIFLYNSTYNTQNAANNLSTMYNKIDGINNSFLENYDNNISSFSETTFDEYFEHLEHHLIQKLK